MKFLLLPAASILAMSLAINAVTARLSEAVAADWRTESVLVGHGCDGSPAPLYREAEDEFPPCRAIERVSLDDVPACDLARLLPTDSNIEACTGRPWYE